MEKFGMSILWTVLTIIVVGVIFELMARRAINPVGKIADFVMPPTPSLSPVANAGNTDAALAAAA